MAECDVAQDGDQAKLFCGHGGIISDVKFASFGSPSGRCDLVFSVLYSKGLVGWLVLIENFILALIETYWRLADFS